jgi:intergrase/recombinase
LLSGFLNPERLNLSLSSKHLEFRAGSSAWNERLACTEYIINIDWKAFEEWIWSSYRQSYAKEVIRLAKKHYTVLMNPRSAAELLRFKDKKRSLAMCSLSCLSKFLGIYDYWKQIIRNSGLKWAQRDSFKAFLRILNSQDSNVLEWFGKACAVLRENEQLFLRFTLLSGLRVGEAVASFNLIIKLSKENKLDSYYNRELQVLEHFRFPETFLRRCKNVFITFIPEQFIKDISKSKTVSAEAIRLRLRRKGLKMRANELRDFYATFMRRYNLIREEIDLIQGRIPPVVFIRHYWSPSLKGLQKRTFKALKRLEKNLPSILS